MIRVPVACVAFALSLSAFAAQPPFGRLFFTPTERAQLDAARVSKQQPMAAAPIEASAAIPPTQRVRYSGIVRRSDGKAIVWLNDRPAEEKDALSDLALTGRVGPDGAVTLHVPTTGSTVHLKVGQSAELRTGKVAETAAVPQPSDQAAKDRSPTQPDSSAQHRGSPERP